jgi:hypothetical protein
VNYIDKSVFASFDSRPIGEEIFVRNEYYRATFWFGTCVKIPYLDPLIN